MLFNSQSFVLAFLPVVLAAYYAVRTRMARQSILTVASLLFYAGWDPRFVPALTALTIANWAVARCWGAMRRNWILSLGIGLNLVILGFCKYTNFVGTSLADLLGATWSPLPIILPLGISFFTFQKISYLIDLRRGDQHVYGLLEFFAFVTFFPTLIAGPLVRHNELIPQLKNDPAREYIWENMGRGIILFVIGFAKKAGLADTVALTVDPVFVHAAAGSIGAAEAWTGSIAYALQIYFDFSGYSDMAIGLGLMFGFRLPVNFDVPYRATSIRDFWRRWHITLSRFLRDYLYIPLGGNRASTVRQAENVVLTMLLGGLWHGAAWTFVAWGGFHGFALAINSVWKRQGWRVPASVGWVLTLLFVVLAWVLFRAPDFGTALRVYEGIIGMHGFGHVWIESSPVLLLAIVIAIVGPSSQAVALKWLQPSAWVAGIAGVALAGLLLLAGGRTPNEFIYFQF